jgi:hypothetical protein
MQFLRLLGNQVKFPEKWRDFVAPNESDPHYNKAFYMPEYDDISDIKDHITLFSREKPSELDFSDVWETTY